MDQTPAGGQACYIYIYITDRGQNLKDLSLGLTLEEKESKNQQRIRISFMKPIEVFEIPAIWWFNDSEFFKYSELMVICKFKESPIADSRMYSLLKSERKIMLTCGCKILPTLKTPVSWHNFSTTLKE
jgi:hypothetical protein